MADVACVPSVRDVGEMCGAEIECNGWQSWAHCHCAFRRTGVGFLGKHRIVREVTGGRKGLRVIIIAFQTMLWARRGFLNFLDLRPFL